MAGLLDSTTAPQIDKNMPTEQLHGLAKQQEAAFVQTAPSEGYLNPNAKIDMPEGAGEGWVKGYLQRQELNRANAELGMKQEKQGWQRTDREKTRSIDDGMVTAAQKGGFEGVLDYLKGVDPDRAMSFSVAKDNMDQSMLKTDVMKVLAPVEKEKALVEGYGIMGKMGQALLNAPATERSNMYQHMLPILTTVFPDAPKEFGTDAVHMMMLGAAQATPENQLFKNNATLGEVQSTVGKLIADKQRLTAKGMDTTEIDKQLQYQMDKADQAHLNLAQTQTNIALGASTAQQKMTQATEAINNNLQNASKDFNTFAKTYGDVSGSIEILKQDPNNTYAQNMLSRSYAMALNKGQLSEADAAVGKAAFGAAEWKKKVDGWASGQATVLNTNEQKMMIDAYEKLMQKNLTAQLSRESQYKQSADQYKGLVNWEAVRKPSSTYYALKANGTGMAGVNKGAQMFAGSAPPQAVQDTIENPQLIPEFVKHYGYDPSQPQQPPGGKQ